MVDSSDLMAATRAVVDPSTSDADLAQIAQAQPSLWPQIAAHPNAYADLLTWLDANGDEATKKAVAARQQAPVEPVSADVQPATEVVADNAPQAQPEPQASASAGESVSPAPIVVPPSVGFTVPQTASTPWPKTPKGRKILFGSLGGLVAVAVVITLIVTLIVVPNQRTADAAAAAQAQAEQEHQDAVTAFTTASDACNSANTALSSAITSAQQTVKTDPATMQDPTLIDKLNQAITTAQTVTPCTAPTMADDTATITQQTAQLVSEAQTVQAASSTLETAASAVMDSVQARKAEDARAAATRVSLDGTLNWTWRGNMLVGTQPYSNISLSGFVFWMPGMSTTKTCSVTPHLPDGESLNYSDTADVTATWSYPSKVFVTYVTLTQENGLTPQTAHHYVQPLDPATCQLGTAIDMHDITDRPSLERTGAWFGVVSETVVLTRNSGPLSSLAKDLGPWVAFDTETGRVLYTIDNTGSNSDPYQFSVSTLTVNGSGTTMPVFDTASRQQYATVNGAAGATFCPPGWWLQVSADESLVHGTGCASDDIPWWTYSTSKGAAAWPGSAYPSGLRGSQSATMTMPDGSLALIFNTGEGLAWFGVDGAQHVIIPETQAEALKLQVKGATYGKIYVATASQQLIIDTDGKQIGTWTGSCPGTSDMEINGVVYSFWVGGSGDLVLTANGNGPD